MRTYFTVFILLSVLSLIVAPVSAESSETGSYNPEIIPIVITSQGSSSDNPSENYEEALKWYNKGVSQVKSGSHDEALKSFNTAYNLDPSLTDRILPYLSYAYIGLEDYSNAISIGEYIVSKDGANARVWNNLGVAYENTGRYNDAEVAYENSLNLDPSSFNTKFNLYMMNLKMGTYTPIIIIAGFLIALIFVYLKFIRNRNYKGKSGNGKIISIDSVEEEIDKAISLINSSLPGADIQRAKHLLSLSGEALEKKNIKYSLKYAKEAQLAANPDTEYLLNAAQKSDSEAQVAFTRSQFPKAIENWETTLKNYLLAEELAKARKQNDDLNTIKLLIDKTRKNIKAAKKSTLNRKMVNLIRTGNSAIKEGDTLFRKSEFKEAISRYDTAEKIFIEALEIAKNESFTENEEIQISLGTIHESIKSSHFGHADLMLKNAENSVQNDPERVESQYYAAIQYLKENDCPEDEIHLQLLNTANKGLIGSKIVQAEKKIKSGLNFLEKREFHNAKEHFRSVLEYLNNIYDEAIEFKFYQDTGHIKKLINDCNSYIEQARSGMLQINEVKASFEVPQEILRGQAKYEGEVINNSSHSGNINYYSPTKTPQELFSKYQDAELIATGGFGQVYKVKRTDGITAAVKIPTSLDKESGNIFLREVENWTKIEDHFNVVSIYDYNVVPFPYIEMEYCEGSLAGLKKPVNPVRAARYIFDLCEGLKIAHRRNIIHRDLKPQNVLLKDNSIKIADWGLSKALSDASSSMTTEIKGTIKYAAPEQLDNRKKDKKTDIWQVGVLFYELVTGTQPFIGECFSEIASAIAQKDPKLPSEYNPELKEFDSVILKCLEKNPEKRYKKVEELQKELASFLCISYSLSLEKSVTQKDIRNSAIFCTELVITNLKINELQTAHMYCEDLTFMVDEENKKSIESLKNQIFLRIEEKIEYAPDELIMAAERIYSRIISGNMSVAHRIDNENLRSGPDGRTD